jgi:hypothetical protein
VAFGGSFLMDSTGVTAPIHKEVRMSSFAPRIFRIVVVLAVLFGWSQTAAAQLQDVLEAQMAVMDEALAGVSTTMIEFTGQM